METRAHVKKRVSNLKPVAVNVSKLSRETGWSVSHLSRVVRGEHGVSVPLLKAMSKSMGINMELLNTLLEERKLYVWKNH